MLNRHLHMASSHQTQDICHPLMRLSGPHASLLPVDVDFPLQNLVFIISLATPLYPYELYNYR